MVQCGNSAGWRCLTRSATSQAPPHLETIRQVANASPVAVGMRHDNNMVAQVHEALREVVHMALHASNIRIEEICHNQNASCRVPSTTFPFIIGGLGHKAALCMGSTQESPASHLDGDHWHRPTYAHIASVECPASLVVGCVHNAGMRNSSASRLLRFSPLQQQRRVK